MLNKKSTHLSYNCSFSVIYLWKVYKTKLLDITIPHGWAHSTIANRSITIFNMYIKTNPPNNQPSTHLNASRAAPTATSMSAFSPCWISAITCSLAGFNVGNTLPPMLLCHSLLIKICRNHDDLLEKKPGPLATHILSGSDLPRCTGSPEKSSEPEWTSNGQFESQRPVSAIP